MGRLVIANAGAHAEGGGDLTNQLQELLDGLASLQAELHGIQEMAPPFGSAADPLEEVISRSLEEAGMKKHPTKKAVLDALPTVVINAAVLKSEDKCVICSEDFRRGKKATKLGCSHHFHTPCIRMWLEQQHNCPVCRYEL